MTLICLKCGKEVKLPKRFRYKNLSIKEFLQKQESRRLEIKKILDDGCECGGTYKFLIPNTKEGKFVIDTIKEAIKGGE